MNSWSFTNSPYIWLFQEKILSEKPFSRRPQRSYKSIRKSPEIHPRYQFCDFSSKWQFRLKMKILKFLGIPPSCTTSVLHQYYTSTTPSLNLEMLDNGERLKLNSLQKRYKDLTMHTRVLQVILTNKQIRSVIVV